MWVKGRKGERKEKGKTYHSSKAYRKPGAMLIQLFYLIHKTILALVNIYCVDEETDA